MELEKNQKFFLSWYEKREFFKFYHFILLIRVRLWLQSYQETKKWCDSRAKKLHPTPMSENTLLYLINVASRYVPKATCLTKALAAQTILHQHNHPSRLLIGVKKTNRTDFEAHAWVENKEGKIICGGEFSSTFKPIMTNKETLQEKITAL